MSANEACDILRAFEVHNDKLVALNSIKGAIRDSEWPEQRAIVLDAIPYEDDRYIAANILETVRYL